MTTNNSSTSPNLPLGEIKDGVHRYPLTGIKTLIVGGGVGGLLAALECYRKGHSVLVLERAPSLSTIGDAFGITPPGHSTFKHYPTLLQDYQIKSHDPLWSYYTWKGDFIAQNEPEWRDTPAEREICGLGGGRIGMTMSRPAHAAVLMAQIERLGIPVLWGRKVVRYEEVDLRAGISAAYTESGERFEADVVIAADGLHSAAQELLEKGSVPRVQPTGYYAARTGFPRDRVAPGTKAQSILSKPGERDVTRIHVGKGFHFIVDATQSWISMGLVYKDPRPKSEVPLTLSPAELLAIMNKDADEWDPALLDLVRQAPKEITNWGLNFRNPHRQWTSPGGHVVMIGDAAHSFLPPSGNGGVQASEDAISIAECLRQGGKENIAWATRVHNLLRYERVTTIQRTGFVNQDVLDNVDVDAVMQQPQPRDSFGLKMGSWMWAHLPEKYAADNFREALAALQSGGGIPFENTNLPRGHKFQEWTMEEEQERQRKGVPSELRSTGDWSA